MPCRPAISSMSLGRAWLHQLPKKLDEAQRVGLKGIEIFHEDLEYFAKALPGGLTTENRIKAATQIKKLCDDRGLEIFVLQPFMHSEGRKDPAERAERIEELKIWFKIAKALGTTMIQAPASYLPESEITGEIGVIVKDFQEMADLGAQQDPPIRFAFESLCFSTYINTWEQCWDVVQKVDRPNFGLCLDTFNIAGKIYGDPASPTGKVPNAEEESKASIEKLQTIDINKIFFLQVVDGERLEKPLVKGHEFYAEDQPARMSWSRNCRLFYGETDRGAYMPVKEITQAIINGLGYDGWVSMEFFNRSMHEPGPEVPKEHADRAMTCWYKIVEDCNLSAKPAFATEFPVSKRSEATANGSKMVNV